MVLSGRKIEKKFTYGDYVTWPENERWELIDGEAYDMTPSPKRIHQKVSGAFFAILWNYLKGKTCEVYDAPFDVRLPKGKEKSEEIDSVVQPDIVVICDPKKLDDAGCRGAPDLIVEILSPGTAAKDIIKKRDLYERHKVKEYWLVHPTDKIVTVYIYKPGKGYGKPAVYCSEDKLVPYIFPDLTIDLKDVFPA